jgi:hypothetical protein
MHINMRKNKITATDGSGGINKTKLASYYHTIMPAVIIFGLFFGLSVVGTANMAAASQIGGGGQELEAEEQQQRVQICDNSGGVTGDITTDNTTKGVNDAPNNNSSHTTATSLYQNSEYGIQIQCPENWVYNEEEDPFTGAFQVTFMSLQDAFEFGTAQESGSAFRLPPALAIQVREPPFGVTNVQQLEDFLTGLSTSQGNQIVSTSTNVTLSGMHALEIVSIEPQNRTQNMQVWTIQDNVAYAAIYGSHESRFNQFLPTAQDMIRSFTITDDTTTATTQSQTSVEESPPTTMTPTTDGGTIDTDDNNNQITNLEAARQQYLAVWNQTEFHIPFSTFIEPGSATGYGVYEERQNNNIFRPGENIVLTLEPVGFGHQRLTDDAGNALYLMNLAADITISDTNGNELASLDDLPLIDFISHRQNTEMHVLATVTQNQPFPLGDYIITYIIHDDVKGEVFQIDKRITIASDDSSVTSNSTATGMNASATTITQSQTSSEPPTTTITPSVTENNQSIDLEAARQQYLTAWNQTEFQIVFDAFIEPGSATAYGVYEKRQNNNIFRPGETIELYAEPVGFGYQRIIDDNGDVLYAMVFTADMILSDVNGNELTRIEDLPLTDFISHRQNTEMFLDLSVTQDEPFPVGDYIVTYIIYDQVTGESYQMDKRITIAAEEDNNGGTASATTTIPQEQRQQLQPQPEQVEWLPYENATYGVRMLYPSDWLQTGGAVGEDGRFVTVSNLFSPEETDWAHVFVAIDNMPTHLESSLNDTINGYNQAPFVRDFQVLSTSMNNFTLAGMPAYTLEATYTDAELGPQQLLAVETIVGGKGYGIQYIASPQTYQQYFPIVERMIESFEIMQEQEMEGGGQQQLQQQQQQPQQNQEESISPIPGLF